MLTLSTQSLEYVRVTVAASVNGAAVNPTGDAILMALVLHETAPLVGDFLAASWETDPAGPTYYARVLVGPNGGVKTYPPNLYDVYLKVVDSPEVPVRLCGQVQVF